MLSKAQADPTPWLPLPEAADWLESNAPAGTERASKYYRARYYDPKIGRFISEDPIGFSGGINFYAYVENNPVNDTDPYGLIGSSDAKTFRQPPPPKCNVNASHPHNFTSCWTNCVSETNGWIPTVLTFGGAATARAAAGTAVGTAGAHMAGAGTVHTGYTIVGCTLLCTMHPSPEGPPMPWQ